MNRAQTGFTLIELLIVVAVIGIIAAIAIPNLLNAMDSGKQKRTMADLRSLATSVEEYAIEVGFYPVASDPWELEPHVRPYYIQAIPKRDAWGNEFEVNSVPSDYTLASCGKGEIGVCNSACTGSCGKTQNYSDDIILSNGSFVQWPEGTQR